MLCCFFCGGKFLDLVFQARNLAESIPLLHLLKDQFVSVMAPGLGDHTIHQLQWRSNHRLRPEPVATVETTGQIALVIVRFTLNEGDGRKHFHTFE